MKKLLKILIGLFVVLFVLFVVALLIVGAHLGDIAKAAINDFGPKITQTPVSVDTVSVSLLGGSAGVKELLVGNPQGYTAPQILNLSNAVVSLVPGSVMSDKIVVRSIEVRGLNVSFEGNPIGENNLTKLMANVDSASHSSNPTTNTTVSPANPAKPAKKFEVDDLVISGVKVDAAIQHTRNHQSTGQPAHSGYSPEQPRHGRRRHHCRRPVEKNPERNHRGHA